MDCREIVPKRASIKAEFAARLSLIRREQFGEDGIAALAEKLRLPARTWSNYERGVTIPGEILLEFLVLTGIEPLWLLHRVGAKYRLAPPPARPNIF